MKKLTDKEHDIVMLIFNSYKNSKLLSDEEVFEINESTATIRYEAFSKIQDLIFRETFVSFFLCTLWGACAVFAVALLVKSFLLFGASTNSEKVFFVFSVMGTLFYVGFFIFSLIPQVFKVRKVSIATMHSLYDLCFMKKELVDCLGGIIEANKEAIK